MKLSYSDLSGFEKVLSAAGLLSDDQVASAQSPGAGNMNFVARVRTGKDRSYIVKQARDYVEKYPTIAAPVERSAVEVGFYQIVEANDYLRSLTPELLYVDADHSILVMEDFGQTRDFGFVYLANQEIGADVIDEVAKFLTTLHSTFPSSAVTNVAPNQSMLELNAEHMYRYPFVDDNGFDLDQVTPGLREVAKPYRGDEKVLAVAKELESIYLARGDTLIHGDFFPGSWLETKDGLRIIDPEFCCLGPREFDLGVATAHLMLADQPASIVERLYQQYQPDDRFDAKLFKRFTGLEIFRRLLGLAQLPLETTLAKKEKLLKEAHRLVV